MRPTVRIAVFSSALALCASVAWPGLAAAQAPLRKIFSFSAGFAYVSPSSDIAADRNGNLYGVTSYGNGCGAGAHCGTVFRLAPPAAPGQPWTEQRLFGFDVNGSGIQPLGKPLIDAVGNVYGTSAFTVPLTRAGNGTVWKLSPPAVAGGSWTFAVLYVFSDPTGKLAGPDGGTPETGLVVDRSGVLYGTASRGGAHHAGVVFSLTPPRPGGTAWTETVLHSFTLYESHPGPLTLSPDQTSLFGSSGAGVIGEGANGGVIYQLHRRPNGWTYHVIHTFAPCCKAAEGYWPVGKLLSDRDDNLFGVTGHGGANGDFGTVFELSPLTTGQTAWAYRVLHSFSGADGKLPSAGPIAGGLPTSLFGTTETGGEGGAVDGSQGKSGVVYRLTPPDSGSGPWIYTALHVFGAGPKSIGGAGLPQTGLTLGPNHLLFGVATFGGLHGHGTVFALRPD